MTPSKLNVTTPTDTSIVMTRAFNVPRQLLWDAMTQPDMLRNWLFSPPGWEMAVCEEDVRPGGSFRWQWQAGGKTVMTMTGTYREVIAPAQNNPTARIVRTESGCLPNGGEVLSKLELAETAGKDDDTTLTITLQYPSKDVRDQMLQMGMTSGLDTGYQRLDAMLEGSRTSR